MFFVKFPKKSAILQSQSLQNSKKSNHKKYFMFRSEVTLKHLSVWQNRVEETSHAAPKPNAA